MKNSLLFCVLLSLTAFLGAGGQSELPSGKKFPATVAYLDGTLTIGKQQGDIGDLVPDGVLLITGPGSRADIIFGEKNIISLGPETQVVFSLSDLKKSLSLQKGSASAVLRKLNALAGGTMDIRTPTTLAGVRGTTFYTSVNDQGQTYFCTCNGSIHLDGHQGGLEFLTENAHHGAYEFIRAGEVIERKVSVLKDHGDEELEALAAKIGVTLDWTTAEGSN